MTFLKKKQLILALVVVLFVPASAPANATDDTFGAMFRMMLIMMNAMSDAMLGNSNGPGWGSASPLGMTTLPMMSGMYGMNPMTGFGGMSPWSGMNSMPMNGMSPWSGMNSMPMNGMSPWSGMNSMPMNGMSPWSTPFNSWSNPFTNTYPSYDNNPYGHRQYGNNYPAPQGSFLDGRWYGSGGDVLEGMIRIDNNIVSLYSPQTGTTTQYSFIRKQSELILQDATGRVLRFWLRPVNSASYRF